jgi:uncharacterized lipoprotein YajG
MTRYKLFISGTFFLTIIVLTGCGVKKDYITINYTPFSGVQRISGAEAVTVKVLAVDERKNKEDVGKKGYEYDFLGAIIVQNDITDTVSRAIQSELQSRGFSLGEGSVVILSQITRFYNEFKGFPEKAVSEVTMNIQVKNKSGSIVFTKVVSGEGVNSDVLLRTGENAKVALDAALKDAIRQLFDDDAFFTALYKASQMP